MSWYVMSMNQINGNLNGAFNDLDMLFYKGESDYEYGSHEWTMFITEAQSFESSQAARDYVNAEWGNGFADSSFAVIEMIKPPDDWREEAVRTYQAKRQDFVMRLLKMTGTEITKEDINDMIDRPDQYGMTFRERQMAKIVRDLWSEEKEVV